MREFLLAHTRIHEIANLFGHSFAEANVETIILHAQKSQTGNVPIRIKKNDGQDFVLLHVKQQTDFAQSETSAFNVFANEESVQLLQKIQLDALPLEEVANIKAGLKAYESGQGTPAQTPEDVKSRPYDFRRKVNDDTHPYLEGKDVKRYALAWSGSYLQYGKNLAAPRTFDLFDGEKIIIREIAGKFPHSIYAAYTKDVYLFNMSNIAVLPKEGANVPLPYLLALLNSKLMAYYFLKNTAKAMREMFPKIILKDLRTFPIKLAENMEFLGEKALEITKAQQELLDKAQKFANFMQQQWPAVRIDDWHLLSFTEWKAVLAKSKIKPTLAEQEEWALLFQQRKAELQELQAQIFQLEEEVNQAIFRIYGLSDAEIALVG